MDKQHVAAGDRPQGHLAALGDDTVTGVLEAASHCAFPSGWQRDICATPHKQRSTLLQGSESQLAPLWTELCLQAPFRETGHFCVPPLYISRTHISRKPPSQQTIQNGQVVHPIPPGAHYITSLFPPICTVNNSACLVNVISRGAWDKVLEALSTIKCLLKWKNNYIVIWICG